MLRAPTTALQAHTFTIDAADRLMEIAWRQISKTLNRFTAAECANYLTNPGYASA
jgi:hypothetical protein